MSYNGGPSQEMPVTRPSVVALTDLRSTVKWLVAAAGATATALVGGLQLTRLHDLTTRAGVISAVAAAVAIALALWLLTEAARILALPRPSAIEISNTEINSGSLDPDDPHPSGDTTVRWVHDHAESLLAGERTVTDLCPRRAIAQRALRDLRGGQSVTWHSRLVTPDDHTRTTEIGLVLQHTEAAMIALEDAVHHHQCQEKLTRLMTVFPWAATVFVVAVIVFAIASASTA